MNREVDTIEKLNTILLTAYEKKASDIHLVVGSAPVFRVDGKLIPQKWAYLSTEETNQFAKEILSEAMLDTLEQKRDIDFSYAIADVVRFRVNVFYQRGALSLSFRIISKDIPSVENLGLPDIAKKLVQQPHGLFLVTGPTGSGKSTSLAALIDYVNQTMSRHIITLEDPIEYLHEHKQSIIEQREVGTDTVSFKNGLRASLRQDPDIILVGELRDMDTISTAITASETGHLVLGTLHTSDAAGSIERMIDVFPGGQREQIRLMLANVLIGILSQRLLPNKKGDGRVAATEMLINNPAIKNLIRTEKMHQIANVLQTSAGQGMHTMEMSMTKLIEDDKIRRYHLYP